MDEEEAVLRSLFDASGVLKTRFENARNDGAVAINDIDA